MQDDTTSQEQEDAGRRKRKIQSGRRKEVAGKWKMKE